METIISQGYFTADGNNKTLKVRSDIDWMQIINITEAAASNNGHGFEYEWQRGMGSTGIVKYHPAGDHTAAIDVATSAFNLIDSSTYALGAEVAVSAGTNATRPVYSTASTSGLADGAIVRIRNTDHTNLNGLDFTIDTTVLNTSFRLANTLATAPGLVAGAAGYWRLVAPNIEIYNMFNPSIRNISNITAATSAVVTTLVDHGYAVGQSVRMKVDSNCGMTQMNNLVGTITAVTASTFTLNIDSSAFTAFKFPLPAVGEFTPAQVIPFGDTATSTYANTFGGSFLNQGFIGMVLTAGVKQPAGSNADVIYWKAGRSF
jgi:hypothetical protein